jgi:uncharacterized protein (DUF433 family)
VEVWRAGQGQHLLLASAAVVYLAARHALLAGKSQSRQMGAMKIEDLKGVIHSDPEIMGGTPVFVGTRVPLQNLIDYLEGGESIEDFLDGFPSVKRGQAIAVIEAAKLTMLQTV